MNTPPLTRLLQAAALALVAAVSGPAAASGDWSGVAGEFHKHIDDYEAEIEALVDEAESIAAARASGKDVDSRLAGYVDRWESVDVHGAIETQATVTYAGIWQGIIQMQQAGGSGASREEFRARVEDLKAALWQGFGAVRLAASQVRSGQAPAAEPAHEDAAPTEVVDAIIGELREAVDAYEAGDAAKAKDLIARAYIQRFEGLEGDLIEQDPDLVTSLEKDFNATLPLAMDNGKSVSAVRDELERMIGDLETAKDLLAESEQSRSEVF